MNQFWVFINENVCFLLLQETEVLKEISENIIENLNWMGARSMKSPSIYETFSKILTERQSFIKYDQFDKLTAAEN